MRAGAVLLRPGGVMDWHSTHAREELIILLQGTVRLDVGRAEGAPEAVQALPLQAGQCAFVPARCTHRVVNRSRRTARYVYVTAPTS